MKILNILVALCLVLFQLYISSLETINGEVLDEVKNPIPFAHIGVSGSKLGTVADDNGKFSLNISKIGHDDTLYVSSIGYSTEKFTFKEIRNRESFSIVLKKKTNVLDEVVIEEKKQKKISYGRSRAYRLSGWVFSGIGNGNEVGRIFRNSKNIEIVDFRFHLKTSDFDSSLYRINIQEVENEELNLINKNEIFVRSTQKKGWVNVDLSSEIIITDQDFLVTVELVKGWINDKETKRGEIVYSAKESGKKETFLRPHKFSDYERIDLVISMRVNAYVLR
ncbi:MAG: carboxypeptidase-like regulatory domain-containing protein [Balneola sp.]